MGYKQNILDDNVLVQQAGSSNIVTAADKFSQVLDVKDFGAVGDGNTDDTAAIQAAVDAAPPASAIIFTAGVYIISSPISIVKSYLHIIGRGGYAVLRGNSGNKIFDVPSVYTYTYTTGTTTTTSTTENIVIGLVFSNLMFENSIFGGDVAIQLDSPQDALFEKLTFRCSNTAIRITDTRGKGAHNTIRDSSFEFTNTLSSVSYLVDSLGPISVKNCAFSDNLPFAINGGHISISTPEHTLIQGCKFVRKNASTFPMVEILDYSQLPSSLTFSNNYVQGADVFPNWSEFALNLDVPGAVITGNTFILAGINAVPAADSIIIINNRFSAVMHASPPPG